MRLALMQPYLFPYIGYFQLIDCCDKFVLHDDIQFIKGGWINRNRILVNGQPKYFTLPLKKAPSNQNINERCFTPDFVKLRQNILRQIEGSYRKAPYFSDVMELVTKVFSSDSTTIDDLAFNSLKAVCDYLRCDTEFVRTTQTYNNMDLMGQDRVIDICGQEKAGEYINPAAGKDLYSYDAFKEKNIDLYFLETLPYQYRQFSNDFVKDLSIIDVLMFNSSEDTKTLLKMFKLIGAATQ